MIFFLRTTYCTHPTIYFLILIINLPLLLSFIFPTFSFTRDPTPISVMIRFFSIISCKIVTICELIVDLGWRNYYRFHEIMAVVVLIYFLCEKLFQQKIEANKISPEHREVITLLSVNQITRALKPLIPCHIRNNPICLKIKLYSH